MVAGLGFIAPSLGSKREKAIFLRMLTFSLLLSLYYYVFFDFDVLFKVGQELQKILRESLRERVVKASHSEPSYVG